MGHLPAAMASTAARAVRLYVSITVNLRSFLEVPQNAILSALATLGLSLGALEVANPLVMVEMCMELGSDSKKNGLKALGHP